MHSMFVRIGMALQRLKIIKAFYVYQKRDISFSEKKKKLKKVLKPFNILSAL